MNRKIKKICSTVFALAITAASAASIPVSAVGIADRTSLSGCNIIDDKGMIKEIDHVHEGYKIVYEDFGGFLKAEPNLTALKFVLSENVDYEDVNERVIEIFKEFYPDNYLGTLVNGMSASEYNDYMENYKPTLFSDTSRGVTTYTLYAYNKHICSIDDEKIAESRKNSKAFMKKLNEEKLISAFYDFGEVYELSSYGNGKISYPLDADIDLIYNYIDEHNIDCTVEKDDYRYKLEFNDDTDKIGQFLIAADIYEETSIPITFKGWLVYASSNGEIFGKNALENLTKAGNANEDETTDIRDAAFIARKVAQRKTEELPEWSDYNNDGKLDILDAAAIAKDVAGRILK